MPASEWQAVVLCGGAGNRMTELTNHIPKCLLPVAGVPIFWYPLNFIQRNSIKDVLLIVNERQLGEVKLLLSTGDLPPLDGLNIEVVPCSNDEYGTADILRQFAGKIKKDFIIVSGDFVSDMSLEPVFSLHRAENSTLTCVLAENVITGPVPGPKIKRPKARDLVALSRSNQLLFLASEEDVDESIRVNPNLFLEFKYANFTAKFNDCHVYLMKRWILDILSNERKIPISSIKADLVPYILEKQYEPDVSSYLKDDRLLELANQFSCGLSNAKTEPKLRCFAYVVTPENGTILAHANNLGAYFEVNKAIVRFLWTRFSEKFPQGLKNEGTVGPMSVSESYINASVFVSEGQTGEGGAARGEKTAVKRSVIGEKTSIGIRARITNSVIMDSCIIGSGAHVSNSILCGEVEIGEGAEVTSSIIANRQKVAPNSKIQNELVAPIDEMDMDE